MTDRFLHIEGVTHKRENVTVLRNLDLSTNAKRIGVVGRNGSGKSSLARLLVGLEAPTAGTIRVFGGDVTADRAFALKHVGIIFQNPDQQIIFPTVGEEIRFGVENLGQGKDAAHQTALRILSNFGAAGWIDKPIYTLSHGQKHLVCLMAILAMQPKFIVLDEPYSGLDIPTAGRMRKLLNGLDQHIMLISHNPGEFEGFEEIIWIEEGALHEHGPCDEVLPGYVTAMQEQVDQC